MEVRAVLFDIDGTLVDSNEQHVNAWALAFREADRPQELDDIRAQIGKGGDLLVPSLFPNVGEVLCKRLADRHGQLFKTMYLDHVHPFPGASDLVERVHRTGRKVALASSAKRDELDFYVEMLGIGRFLEAIASIDEVAVSKPEPDIFSVALTKLGIAAGNAIVVGDTPYDVEAATRVGIAAVGLTSGPFDRKVLKDAGAIAVFADVADLLNQFDRSPLMD